jgi:hypothetical protein
MLRFVIVCGAALGLAACQMGEDVSSDTKIVDDANTSKAWSECLFELDKVESIRGRNLDDLNKGQFIARNQFLVDCMSAKTPKFLPEHIRNMSTYAGGQPSRSPTDINLNNGRR